MNIPVTVLVYNTEYTNYFDIFHISAILIEFHIKNLSKIIIFPYKNINIVKIYKYNKKMNNDPNNEKLHLLMKKLEKEGMEKTFLINKKYEILSLNDEIPMRNNSNIIIFILRKYCNIICSKIMKRWSHKKEEFEYINQYMNELEDIINDGYIEFEREMGRKMTFTEMRIIYG